jgi:hypothetical protein
MQEVFSYFLEWTRYVVLLQSNKNKRKYREAIDQNNTNIMKNSKIQFL